MTANKTQLVFIYNAKSSPINQAIDFFHKMASSATYPCNLNKLTHDGLNKKPEWQNFVKTISKTTRFLYKDEFQKKYPDYHAEYPTALIGDGNTFTTFISAEEMNSFTTLGELVQSIKDKIKKGSE